MSSTDSGLNSLGEDVNGLEIVLLSSDQSPKSISWQRLQQNGRWGFSFVQATLFLQVGHSTVSVIIYTGYLLNGAKCTAEAVKLKAGHPVHFGQGSEPFGNFFQARFA